MSRPTDLGSLKVGSYMMIEGEPCKIVEYDKSKPGKHGSAKARVVGIGLFDDVKRSHVSPVSANVEVPMLEKKTGQVISMTDDIIQLMDLANYEVFDVPNTTDTDLKNKIQNGVEIEYWRVLGRNKLVRVKG
ncbi:MAG: translation initiation factor IF-5A [Thaumarchaeota archaeon]|nr:translation initiation factor IF-5A [Nitrososphaerota archaeon]MCZ6615922.1 translation initiation factor IF-5A [Nitrososphaerota archaeon]